MSGRIARLRFRLRHRLGLTALRLAQRLNERTYLPFDYPPSSTNRPRYGYGRAPHPQLAKVLGRYNLQYRTSLDALLSYADDLRAIRQDASFPSEPYWRNGSFSGLDAISLYGFIRSMRPKRYLEVGSGISTKFARRAVADGSLATRITSVDPAPRADIDSLCDEVIRRPLETVDLGLFENLDASDIVLLDCSHRVFMNSDVTTFFLDVLPNLSEGVLVCVHDIFLPEDYPPEWSEFYFSEQYLLAAYLLAGGPLVEPVLACNYVSRHPGLSAVLDSLYSVLSLDASLTRSPGCFWLTVRPNAQTDGDASAVGTNREI
jgi:hypothetical protein